MNSPERPHPEKKPENEAIERLKHDFDECTGPLWRLSRTGKDKCIKCDGCGATYPVTDENRLAAFYENHAGISALQATKKGQASLDEDKEKGEGWDN